MSLGQAEKLLLFFSYARQDRGLRDKLEEHLSNLKYRELITTWHIREIGAGEDWQQQVDIHLESAHIILLLISSSFMASQYCYSTEMTRAMERHQQGKARVIPVLLRPVLFFLQALHLPCSKCCPPTGNRWRAGATAIAPSWISRWALSAWCERRRRKARRSTSQDSLLGRSNINPRFQHHPMVRLPSSRSRQHRMDRSLTGERHNPLTLTACLHLRLHSKYCRVRHFR